MKKQGKNSSPQRRRTIFLVGVMIMFILFLPMVSSWDIDNIKSYNSQTKVIEIRNSVLGIPFLQLDKIAEVTLNTPTNNYVIRGKDRLVAEFTINNYADNYDTPLKNLEFYNVKDSMNKFNRVFTYKQKIITGQKERKEIHNNCTTDNDINVTTCKEEIIKIWMEDIYEWKTIDEETLLKLPVGNITIGIFTDVYADEKIEWIPTLFGVQINEWATWTEGLNTNLKLYATFNNTLENVVNASANVTAFLGSPWYVNGKITKGRYYDTTNADLVLNSTNISFGTNGTLSFWVLANVTGVNQLLGIDDVDSSGDFSTYINAAGNFVWNIDGLAGSVTSNDATFTNTSGWQMITLEWSVGEGMKMWINDTLQANTDTLANNIMVNRTWAVGCIYRTTTDSCVSQGTGGIDELSMWKERLLTQAEISQIYNNGTGIAWGATTDLIIDVDLIFPLNNSNLASNEFFVGHFNTSNGNMTNVTLYIWKPDKTLFGVNTTTITGTTNVSNISLSNLFVGNNYQWNYLGCALNSTGSGCKWDTINMSFNILGFTENSFNNYNTTSYEMQSEYFSVNITTFNGETPTNAKLIYNNTQTTATIASIGGNNFTLSANVYSPFLSQPTNKTFFFNFTINGTNQNLNQRNQTVYPVQFLLCNATYGIPYLNFTFKDEDTLGDINASITSSTFTYYLSTATLNQTFTYQNTPENKSYGFCASPESFTYYVNPIFNYKNAGSPQRTWNPGTLTLTNNTLNQTLYLLSTSDGQYVTYQVINSAEQPLENVQVNATRLISGTTTIVGSGITDAAGSITFWLNPDYSHTFSFFKTGYEQFITTITPTQTSYTITLGGGTTTTANDYTQGVTISIKPPQGEFLYNSTVYHFNYTLTSSYWDIDEFGFILRNLSGTNLGSTSAVTNGGIIDTTANTWNNTRVLMNYYYIIDGNYTNGTTSWTIVTNEDLDYSIKNFFDRIKTYLDAGTIFGLQRGFSLSIIIYFIIFVFVGVMSYKFGMTNPTAIFLLIFGLVGFFDIGLGMLSLETDLTGYIGLAVEHFPTIIIALILIGILFREVFR